MSVWRDDKTGKWIAKFKFQGKQYKKEALPTMAAAKQWEADKLRELKAPPPPPEIPSVSFADLATRYLEHCKARMQRNTWRAKAHYYRGLVSFLGRVPGAEELTKLEILDFLEHIQKTDGAKVANRHLKDLKALYNWGFGHDLIKTNPCKTIEPFAEEKSVKYVPPAEDIDKVLMAADQDDMDLLIVLYHTGGRIGEIFRLTWGDVNFEKRWIRLWTRKRRRGELQEDRLAMSDKLYHVLRRRWDARDKGLNHVFTNIRGTVLTYQSKRNLMRRLCQKAGVKEFGFHAIRHHVASIIADSGKATLGQIQKFLRHRRPSTTEGYLHEVSRDLTEIADLLDTQDKEKKGEKRDTSSGKVVE